ncbi:MAG: bifunctional oligoribonuclease/PAP phosphatase NrnA, partial [Chitinophagia bacterium]|nr:bifunctional oligoribonuclease/PAP phosphatase NrnA [Chitinophagia bacterium]
MQPIEKSFSLLQNPKRIFIATHYNPDGDALGSILGLQHYLKSKGHEVTAVTPNDVPAYLEWMPGANALINYEKNTAVAEKALAECDIIFVVDLNDPSRTRNLENSLTQATQPKILIDHHLFPNPIWDYGISLPEKSSTCEMVFDFIAINGDKHLITQKIATCLYTGI